MRKPDRSDGRPPMIENSCDAAKFEGTDAVAMALLDNDSAATLAAAADDEKGGQAMMAKLLRHELANSHVLMMRAASKARAYIERIDPQAEAPRFDREAVRMSGIV